jgi:GDP-4-dehydro-6-deoxy-D-mannose reductase
MSKLLIFGSGFLSQYISKDFIDTNNEVKVIYNNHIISELDTSYQIKMDSIINLIEFIQEYKPDYILFAIGDSFVPNNINVQNAINKNLSPILEILDKIHKNKKNINFIKKIIIIGSAAEYGNVFNDKIDETTKTHPYSIYWLTKIFLYNSAMYYIEKGLPIIYVRQFNVIGPHQRDLFVLPSFCKQIAQIEKGLKEPKIEVWNLSHERDFTDVRDVANAYHLLFEHGKIWEIYNIWSWSSVKIQKILDILLENTSFKGLIKIVKNKELLLNKNVLSNILLCDNTKLKKLGFKRNYEIKETILDTLTYWKKSV